LTLTEYFRPENPIALAIVCILWCVFVIWLFSLVHGGARIHRYGRTIRTLIRATPDLVAARLQRQVRRSQGLKTDTTPSDEFRAHLPPEVVHDDPLAIHLENIYAAGCSESRLDIGELLLHTERMISQGDNARLHFLSIFLIIGLLGTLFGLADSILALLLLLKQSADVGSNLVALLSSLKGAFAPSISGVLTSIIGTGVYAFYNRVYVSPLIGQLREATINFWVPELYPTTGQIAAEAAQRSLDAAVKVTESSEHIREDTEKLASTLRTAVGDTQNYAEAIDKLSVAIRAATEPATAALAGLAVQLARFDEAMSRWAQFESTLKALHEELTANQKLLAARSAEIGALIGSQTERLGAMSSGLENTHREALAEVRDAYKALSERMSSLQVPFTNTAEQVLNQTLTLQRFAERQLEIYSKTLTSVEGLPAALVSAFAPESKNLAERIAQGMQALAEARQHPPSDPWDAVRQQLAAGFGEQNQVLRELIESVRALNAPFFQAAAARADVGQVLRPGGAATHFGSSEFQYPAPTVLGRQSAAGPTPSVGPLAPQPPAPAAPPPGPTEAAPSAGPLAPQPPTPAAPPPGLAEAAPSIGPRVPQPPAPAVPPEGPTEPAPSIGYPEPQYPAAPAVAAPPSPTEPAPSVQQPTSSAWTPKRPASAEPASPPPPESKGRWRRLWRG